MTKIKSLKRNVNITPFLLTIDIYYHICDNDFQHVDIERTLKGIKDILEKYDVNIKCFTLSEYWLKNEAMFTNPYKIDYPKSFYELNLND